MLNIKNASLAEINQELASGGFPSSETDLVVARRALRNVYEEMGWIAPPVSIRIYWDVENREEECWAFQSRDERGQIIDMDRIEGLDPKNIDGAICETIHILGLHLTSDMFATSDDDGGYAVWDSVPEWMLGE
jgi:hypothetical protein